MVNLSYDAFPALRALSRVVPDAAFIGTPAFAGPVLAAQPGFDVVITGLTGGSLGTLQDLWQPLPSDILAGFSARLSPRNQAIQDQAGNLGALF